MSTAGDPPAPAGAPPARPDTRVVDLHLHTCFSDGTYTPEELAEHAGANGLSGIAVTDHDTLEGCERVFAACARRGIEFLPGTEMTAEVNGSELHLLAYGVDTLHPQLLSTLARFQLGRQERIREMVERLNRRQIPLRADTVFALANCQSPGRPHVARALVQEGYCHSVDEAFDRFLKKHRPGWVPKTRMSALDAITLTRLAGGVSVMAHPGLHRNDAVLPGLIEAGLDGIECWHTKHPPATAEHYLALTRHYGLLATGGSDCHGLSKGRPLIGSVRVAFEHFIRLRETAAHRQRAAAAGTPVAPSV